MLRITRTKHFIGMPSRMMLRPGGGLMRRTQPLYIPPIIARIVVGAAMVVGQSFWDAHCAEAEKLQKNQAVTQQTSLKTMPAEEALQILNINANLAVPLRGVNDREEAKKNFERLFESAKKLENPFMMGKLSAAYRVAVDPTWDSDSTDATDENVGKG